LLFGGRGQWGSLPRIRRQP